MNYTKKQLSEAVKWYYDKNMIPSGQFQPSNYKMLSDWYWKKAEDLTNEIAQDSDEETCGPRWEKNADLQEQADRYREMAINYEARALNLNNC